MRRAGHEGKLRVYAVVHQPSTFTARSAFPPLIEQMGMTPVYYDVTWERWQKKSWTLGLWLRRAGNRYYGSTWNALVPWVDEVRFLSTISPGRCIVHFLWGEFASPRMAGVFKRRGAVLVGTFHCGARRQRDVLGHARCIRNYDRLNVVSATQVPFFLDCGIRKDRIEVIPLGIDTDYFRPAGHRTNAPGPMHAILVGNTERDHEFMATVMRGMPEDVMLLDVCTHPEYHKLYAGIAAVRILQHLPDEQLLSLYQQADLMIMPMLDCTANDAMLEAMACGTPVMTNRVGGVTEYVDAESSIIMDGKDAGQWVDRIVALARDAAGLQARRPAVRAWAERFSWEKIAPLYQDLYRRAMSADQW